MAAPLYASATRAVALPDVSAPLLAALKKHAETASIVLADDVRVWYTHRANPPSTSFFGKLLGRRSNPVDADAEHDMVLVLHRAFLLVGTHGAARGTSVLSLALANATVTRGSAIGAAFGAALDAPSDDGLTIAGFPGHEGRPGTYFFGLGGAEADTCFEAVRAAVSSSKNPA